MKEIDEDVKLPVVVRTSKKNIVSIYSPDLRVTVHGPDYNSAWADAAIKLGAMYYYALERNIRYNVEKDLSKCNALCKRSGDFPTYMTLSRS